MSTSLRLGWCWVLVYLLGTPWALGQTVQFVPGSTLPRVQLTGEHFQIYSNGKYFTDVTPARTLSRFGVLGTDLGIPVSFGDKIVLMFGDTIGVYPSGSQYRQARTGPNGAADAIGYIPNADFSQCHYIRDVDQQLTQGVTTPSVSAAACPSLNIYTDPARAPDGQVFKPMVISPLLAGESQGVIRVPTGGFAHNDRLYMFYITMIQENPFGSDFSLQSVMARSDQAAASWSNAAPPTFSRLYTVSSHPPIADPANPPAEAGDIGKFMFNSAVVMDTAKVAGAGLTQGLPAALQNVPNVVFVFGTGIRRSGTNLYLAAFSLTDADAGPSKWFYYKGGNQWSASEAEAAPLLATSNVTEQSVVWNSALRRFVLMRIGNASVQAQFSTTPWGPWSDPVSVLSGSDSWIDKLMHHPGADPLVQSLITIYDRNGNPVALPDSETGFPYSPSLLDTFTQNSDGSVTVYYTMSTWNPYQVFLMSSTFVIPPTMTLDKTSLTFAAVSTGAAFTSQTSAQTVRLTQTGAGAVTWTAASTTPWLVVSPTSGSGSTTLTISTQFASGLTAMQTGSITLTLTGAANTAGPIGVTLHTTPAGTAPSGSFDTPLDGATGVTGSIAVTGWALDDIEVTGVRILRDPVAGEPAGTLVFIGHAVLVDGARPDVQALFPTAPRNTRAGWGYLMLTNFLPNLGNGTFRLTAIADDADGHSTPLGTKTITVTNSTATTPTGAIDTPAQGGTVSGNVTNFGWVLSPSPYRADPPGGGTVQVVIDGAFLSAVPSGWTSRSDLTALFPASQFPGIVNALGVAAFDSTALANGVHTISWVVTDNVGSASGIGSRYFTVSNGSLFLDPAQAGLTASDSATAVQATATLAMPRAAALRIADSATVLASEVDAAPVAFASIKGRRGFSLDTPLQAYTVREGLATIQSEELDRIELHLEGIEGAAQSVESTAAGYLRVAGGLAPLPIGSALNASTGVFTWAPGVGFVGTYDLVFVRWTGARAVARQDVRIVLNPKGSNRVGPQTVIDTPPPAKGTAVVGPSFVLAGWAADLDATVNRGVDAVHVWAYPVTPSTPSTSSGRAGSGQAPDPIWIGAATYGGARPDVAAVYGDRFLTTGYGIAVQGLAPGTYDLAVFAYSTVSGGFVSAKTVRVTVR